MFRFVDPFDASSYTFPVGPTSGTMPVPTNSGSSYSEQGSDGNIIYYQPVDLTGTITLNGTMFTFGQYEDLITWTKKKRPVVFIDALDRQFLVAIKTLSPTRTKGFVQNNPSGVYQTYSLTMLVLNDQWEAL